MKRRDFLKTSVIASAALSLNFEGLQAALSTNSPWRYRKLRKERTKDRDQAEYRLGPLS